MRVQIKIPLCPVCNRFWCRINREHIKNRLRPLVLLCLGLSSCEPQAPVAQATPKPTPADYSGIVTQGAGQSAPLDPPTPQPTPVADQVEGQRQDWQAQHLKQLEPPPPQVIQSNPRTLFEYMNQTGAAVENAKAAKTQIDGSSQPP